MDTVAIPLSRFASRPSLPARLPHFIALMKQRMMALAVFTAIVGLAIAPGHRDPPLAASFALFAPLLVSNGGGRWSALPAATAAVNAVGSLQVEPAARSLRADLGSISLGREV